MMSASVMSSTSPCSAPGVSGSAGERVGQNSLYRQSIARIASRRCRRPVRSGSPSSQSSPPLQRSAFKVSESVGNKNDDSNSLHFRLRRRNYVTSRKSLLRLLRPRVGRDHLRRALHPNAGAHSPSLGPARRSSISIANHSIPRPCSRASSATTSDSKPRPPSAPAKQNSKIRRANEPFSKTSRPCPTPSRPRRRIAAIFPSPPTGSILAARIARNNPFVRRLLPISLLATPAHPISPQQRRTVPSRISLWLQVLLPKPHLF